jgi:Antirestriction protein
MTPNQKELEMNTVIFDGAVLPTATLVQEEERLKALPDHFGRDMQRFRASVYDWARRLSTGYNGGYWEFYELSNGGFYMAPKDEPFEVYIPENTFRGRLSADAFGITACLHAYRDLATQLQSLTFADHHEWLLEFANVHPEANAICSAID